MNAAPTTVHMSGTSPKIRKPRILTHKSWVYENGASTEASPYRKASTTIHCPAVDATPIKIPNRISCQLGVTQTNGTSTETMQMPAIAEKVMVVSACSLPLIIRVMIKVQAHASAET